MTRLSVLGGETGGRGLLGAGMSRQRKVGLVAACIVGGFLTLSLHIPGAVITVCLIIAVLVATTGENTLWTQHVARARLRDAAKRGTDVYRPYDAAEWERLASNTDRSERKAVIRALAALRQMPPGADGMGWLDMRASHPGVAWHAPRGESEYFSVCFAVTGQLRGIQSSRAVDQAGELFGRFQASLGKLSSLASGVQTLTRVLPPDSARHEAWVRSQLAPLPERVTGDDETARRARRAYTGHIEAVRSYDALLRQMSRGAMISRHYVIVTWRNDARFAAAAATKGPGRDGWRELMADEIASIRRRLQAAGEGRVDVLTARQTAAVIRNMQHPDWPIDQAADVDPTLFGMASDPAPKAHHVSAPGPDGHAADWYHATAQAVPASIATGPRTLLWLLPVLTNMRLPIIRTVSITRVVVPTGQAKRSARQDVTSDQAQQLSDRDKGRLVDEDTVVRLNAAKRRRADLAPGTGHAGVEYLIHVTVSARTPEALAQARRQMSEAFDNSLGIEQLEWFDSYQPAASGLTWPIGRGLRPPKTSWGDRFERRTARD
ncbi:hypothetical protein [Cellulomonas sp. HD19AZ1]|uniref:hypothetical protein n=1 Tax=Cellulomonas sp. HD19AZ1 TaxID=2559593 RepID=UPI001071498F|nr:hypothetical protein [Cellulomonas sp. HD19AZ1]TFH68160.1 hypothetical protein E4A51_18115 [Cellulomonas sp. HD19AZ1]